MANATPPALQPYPLAANVITAAAGLYNLLSGTANHLNFSISEGATGVTVTFIGFDTPEKLGKLGGPQRTATHEYPGGLKTLQTLGQFPNVIRVTGTLIGQVNGVSPINRALQMDLLRRHGLAVTMSYGGQLSWLGVVTMFEAELLHQNRITYTLEFEPVIDNSLAVPGAPTVNLGGLFGNAIGALQSFLGSAAAAALPADTLTSLQAVVDYAGTVMTSTGGVITKATSAQQTTILSMSTTSIGLLNRDAANENVQTSAAASSQVANVEQMINVLSPNASGTQQVVQVVNPNFVSLAAKYYGDATMWPTIAAANGTSDTTLPGVQSITIPNINA